MNKELKVLNHVSIHIPLPKKDLHSIDGDKFVKDGKIYTMSCLVGKHMLIEFNSGSIVELPRDYGERERLLKKEYRRFEKDSYTFDIKIEEIAK